MLTQIIDSLNTQPYVTRQYSHVLWQLIDTKGFILLVSLLLELAIPIPNQWRIGTLAPILRVISNKVNRAENSTAQSYFAGFLLPVLLLGIIFICILLFGFLADFDPIYSLFILPLLLQSRPNLLSSLHIKKALDGADKIQACALLEQITHRQVDKLSEIGICKATCEVVIMRMFTGYFAVAIWYLLLGLSGAIVMQLYATLALIFSTKIERYEHFGACISRVERLMLLPALIPLAMLSMLSFKPYAALASARLAMRKYSSPITGFVLGLVGKKFDLSLGGPRYYNDMLVRLPAIGGTQQPDKKSPLVVFHRLRFYTLTMACCVLAIQAWLMV